MAPALRRCISTPASATDNVRSCPDELFHLVGDDRRETEAAWKFVRSGAIDDDRGFGTSRHPGADVTLLGPSHGFCRCNSRIPCEAGIAGNDFYRGSFRFRNIQDRGTAPIPRPTGKEKGVTLT